MRRFNTGDEQHIVTKWMDPTEDAGTEGEEISCFEWLRRQLKKRGRGEICLKFKKGRFLAALYDEEVVLEGRGGNNFQVVVEEL